MRKIILYAVLFLATAVCNATDLVWHAGSVVLENQTVLTGQLTIEPKTDLVLVKNQSNNSVDVFPAYKIRAVFFYDSSENINRRFISIQQSHGYKLYRLYEIVVQGQVSLLRIRNEYDRLPGEDDGDFRYVIRYENDLIPMIQFRTRIYPALINSSLNGFALYVRQHKLNPNVKSNAIRIIQCYNDLYVHQTLSMR